MEDKKLKYYHEGYKAALEHLQVMIELSGSSMGLLTLTQLDSIVRRLKNDREKDFKNGK